MNVSDLSITVPASSAVPDQHLPASSGQKEDTPYGAIPGTPVMEGPEGIRYDFNWGFRILFPKGERTYHLKFRDLDRGVVLFDQDVPSGALVMSAKKYYISFRFSVSDPKTGEELFSHDMVLKDKETALVFPVGTLGDSIGWFSYAERFQKKHQCRLTCVMSPAVADLLRKSYPEIRFSTREEFTFDHCYASYYPGLYFNGDTDHQPADFRYMGLHRTAGNILGLEDLSDLPPRFDLAAPRKIREKYVCIAAQSSSQAKYWNNPMGWREVISFLKGNGYRVLCVDRYPVTGMDLVWNHIPWGAEDFTGDLPLQERVDLIKDADFFIGLSSGLSWLAWGCRVPVVLISGFTHPENEFYTPYRVFSPHVCNSCWNDMRVEFDHHDFFWCPRHKGTARQFECSRLISASQVISAIKRIPAFQAGTERK